MKSLAKLTIISILSFIFSITTTLASSRADISKSLRELKNNPKKFMNAIPRKKILNKKMKIVPLFSKEAIRSKKYIDMKNKRRPFEGRARIEPNDRPERLVDNGNEILSNIEEMNRQKLDTAALAIQPWSDHYWPLYQGQTAYRYADPSFPSSEDWKKNFDYIMESSSNNVDTLSPAEKYDLLVGDTSKALTNSALDEGKQYYHSGGKVETWMGICHGWAPAAYMLDRPTSAVTVTASDGRTQIKFYPADIKALASLLWATHSGETNFIGGRCNVKNPKKDENERVSDQDCFDTNPGAWHIALVNQIGINKRSLVMDATYDYEVWNQPIQSYEYTYFNPETKANGRFSEAKISRSDFRSDKFQKYRNPNARYIVGVAMTLKYVAETTPSAKETDSSSDDNITSVDYFYDLELDENDNIVGGEWYQNAHPDFLWTPTKEARAMSPGDSYLARSRSDRKAWNTNEPMPKEWQEVAKKNSSGGSPLAVVVEKLIQFSNENSGSTPRRRR